MAGNQEVRFSELFRDTVETHGIEWAYGYYVCKHGMQYWEFLFWANSLGLNGNHYYM